MPSARRPLARPASSPRGSRPALRSSWLGRGKNVIVSYPNRYQCIVGQPFLLSIDLSAALPTRSDVPAATLVVSVLANAPNESRQTHEALIVWSAKQTIPASTEATTIELGPLSVAGEQQLSITLDGQHVRDSPHPLYVLPGPPSPVATELIGGPTGSRVVATAGQPACFFILLNDACGNRCAGGLKAHSDALQFHVALRPISGAAADGIGGCSASAAAARVASSSAGGAGGVGGAGGQVTAASQLALRSGEALIPAEEPSYGLRVEAADAEGSVAVHFMRHRAGEYEALVHIGAHRIMPPLSVEVRAGPPSAPHCHAEGAALEEAVCHEEMRFTLLTYDAHGNRRSKGEDDITAYLLLRDPLGSNRWGESARATVDAAAAAYGHDRPGGYGVGGAAAHRKAYPGARDGLTFVARAAMRGIDQPSGGKVRVSVADEGDGSYRCMYYLLHAGEYALHILVAGAPIVGSPFSTSVLPSYLAPTTSTASGAGLKHAVAGEAALFHVIPRDPSVRPSSPHFPWRRVACPSSPHFPWRRVACPSSPHFPWRRVACPSSPHFP